MRLFVAVDLDDAAKRAIAAEQQRIGSLFGRSDRTLRWVRPEQMHLTLVFVGEVDETRGAAIAGAMSEPLPVAPFALAFGRIGMFPARGAPSVLWLGVTTGVQEAVAAQRLVASRLEPLGVARDPRPYHPHLTLARWRSARPADRGVIAREESGVEVIVDRVDRVVLYRSHLSSSGPRYEALARASLPGT
jgi:2'-5' RNA ligase